MFLGYRAHIPGITSSNIFGTSYAKATSIAIKGDYVRTMDIPPQDRYKSVFNQYYTKPKMRLDDDFQEVNPKSKMFDPNYNPNEEKEKLEQRNKPLPADNPLEMASTFRKTLELDKKPLEHVK